MGKRKNLMSQRQTCRKLCSWVTSCLIFSYLVFSSPYFLMISSWLPRLRHKQRHVLSRMASMVGTASHHDGNSFFERKQKSSVYHGHNNILYYDCHDYSLLDIMPILSAFLLQSFCVYFYIVVHVTLCLPRI